MKTHIHTLSKRENLSEGNDALGMTRLGKERPGIRKKEREKKEIRSWNLFLCLCMCQAHYVYRCIHLYRCTLFCFKLV